MSTYDHRTPAPAPAPGSALAELAMASYVLPALAQVWPRLREALGVESRTTSGAGYALTFDDGPHAQGTVAVLETLAAAGAHATFFLVGEQLRRNPSLGGEITAAGHTIGLHCDRHRNLLRMAPRQVRADIDRAQATIEDLTGRSPAIYRPPYGMLNASALRLARRRGWRTLLWSGWGRDWERRATPASIASLVTQGASEGSVLLLHDADDYGAPGSWRQTAAALPRVLETLAARGLQPVPA
jgi:peptidoglycan/xylan/chitin deacetylase (PgdA/CDA1 family)